MDDGGTKQCQSGDNASPCEVSFSLCATRFVFDFSHRITLACFGKRQMSQYVGIVQPSAWYQAEAFDMEAGIWPDASGEGNDATLSGSGLQVLRKSGHGTSSVVVALAGTTSDKVSFGDIIKAQFTICSVTRYTSGPKKRILAGGDRNWLHGHWGNKGKFFLLFFQ